VDRYADTDSNRDRYGIICRETGLYGQVDLDRYVDGYADGCRDVGDVGDGDLNETNETIETGLDTTLTLDHKHIAPAPSSAPTSTSASASAHAGPRLSLMSLKRDRRETEDVKEVHFSTTPGERTTVLLTVSNHSNKAGSMRYVCMYVSQ
jgi:hypothetical protein